MAQRAKYLPSIQEAPGLTSGIAFLGIVAHTCHPRIWSVKAEGSGVYGRPQLGSEFQASMSYA